MDPARATRIAEDWFDLPFPAFKRLALFAASKDDGVAPKRWVQWLTSEEGWWLWSTETHREALRLLVTQAKALPPNPKARLEAAILAGPPRDMYLEDIELDWWDSHVKQSVWLRLAKFAHDAQALSPAVQSELERPPDGRSNWKTARDSERNEFQMWMSSTGEPEFEEMRDIDVAPESREELTQWLKRDPPKGRPFYEDTWGETCRARLQLSVFALQDLAKEGLWPSERWRVALQAWSERDLASKSWPSTSSLLQRMPDDTLQEIDQAFCWWVEKVSKSTDQSEAVQLDLCGRALNLVDDDDRGTEQPVFQAINHPIGRITQTFLNIWFKRQLNDNDLLPPDIEPFFTRLCDRKTKQFRHGRIILASHLTVLFRVDRSWTETNLLPYFDWSVDTGEAKGVWEGFLSSPRMYQPLLIAFKAYFLDTAFHYALLDERPRQFAQFLVLQRLTEWKVTVRTSSKGHSRLYRKRACKKPARTLVQSLESSGEQREMHWRHRILPFWKQVWPQLGDLASNDIAQSLARLSVAAGDEFRTALPAVINWLQPLRSPDYILHLLTESGICGRYPGEALQLLGAIIDERSWLSRESIERSLNAIAVATPNLRQNPTYRRLDALMLAKGH